MNDAERIASILGGAKKAGAGWNCLCPVHDDAKASLNIAVGDDGTILVHCYAGCDQGAVLAELRGRGLMNGRDTGDASDFSIAKLGKAVHVWTYRDATASRNLLKVARYETSSGKEFRPWIPDGARWKCAALQAPRPLYGLERLARAPALPVIVTEGEKACEAARELVGERAVVTTWPGGANAADKADWAPLRGRKVTLWPDADHAGAKAMQTVAAKLARIAAAITIVNVGTRSKGWDLADAKAEGWTGDDVLTFCDDHAQPIEATLAAEGVAEPDDELEYVFAHELGDEGDEADELVERLLTREAMGVIYGDSNSGKTFLAIDVACAVPRHILWMGRNVEPGMVLYLATESPASVKKRLRAYQKYHGCKVPNFVIVKSPIDLYNGAADTERVIKLVLRLERRLGVKCVLVVGDTLSRLCAGANENSGEDMSIVVRHIERIRHEAKVHFLLIHHTGKDAARGMRGWSGMRAATDTEIEVTENIESGSHAAEVTKQRDIEGKGDRIGFRLEVVEMGIGKWGRPITSCVVVGADAPAKQAPGKRPSEIAGAIVELLTSRGAGMRKKELVAHFEGRYLGPSVYKEIRKMKVDRRLHEVVGIIGLVPQ